MKISVFEFFKLFPGKITIQTFCDKKLRGDLTRIIHFDVFDEGEADNLDYLNSEGAGIFFCVNETDGKGRKTENVKKVRAVYADMDGAPLEKALEFSPSLIVESSAGRFHCYWLVKDVPLEGFKTLQQSIIRALNSDQSVHDLPRVLRVPGYMHLKYEPFLVNIHSVTGDIFNYKELTHWFPPEKVPQWSAKRYKLEPHKSSELTFHGTYGTNDMRNVFIFKRICGMIGRKVPLSYIENEARKEAMACNPPMDEHELNLILNSAITRYYK
jgi:hypothetical protein